MRPYRVFIDTNILLSGLAFGGNETRLLRLAGDGRVRLVLSAAVLHEIRDVVNRKFPELAGDLDEFLERVSWESVDYPPPCAVESALSSVRDPDDAPILASILLAKPDFALTGDKDLLTDRIKGIVPMCRCAEFLRDHPELTTDN